MVLTPTVRYIADTLDSGDYEGAASGVQYANPFNKTLVGGAGDTSNIKHITIRLTTAQTDADLNKSIILNAFSCNIGSYELDERSF